VSSLFQHSSSSMHSGAPMEPVWPPVSETCSDSASGSGVPPDAEQLMASPASSAPSGRHTRQNRWVVGSVPPHVAQRIFRVWTAAEFEASPDWHIPSLLSPIDGCILRYVRLPSSGLGTRPAPARPPGGQARQTPAASGKTSRHVSLRITSLDRPHDRQSWHGVIDDFSRKLLAWEIATKLEPWVWHIEVSCRSNPC
jgi:hypothetical protein